MLRLPGIWRPWGKHESGYEDSEVGDEVEGVMPWPGIDLFPEEKNIIEFLNFEK